MISIAPQYPIEIDPKCNRLYKTIKFYLGVKTT